MNTSFKKHRLMVMLFAVLALVASACGTNSDPDTEASAPDTVTETTLGSAAPVDSDAAVEGDAAGEDAPADDATEAVTDDAGSDDGEAMVDDGDDESSAVDNTDGGDNTNAISSTLGSSLLAGTLDGEEVTTARFEGNVTIVGTPSSELPGELSLTFTGAYDLENNASEISMDFGDLANAFASGGGDPELELFSEFFAEPLMLIQVGDKAYINWGLFSLFTGQDDVWIETAAEDSGAITEEFAFAGAGSPTEFLKELEDANATVEELGRENLRGVDTTHFRAIVDAESASADMTAEERADFEETFGANSEFPIDFWIDDDGLVRKFALDLTGDTLDDPEVESASMTFEIYDYGEEINIQAPPADKIITEEELGFDLSE